MSTGRLVLLWYAGFLLAALLVHYALGNAESIPIAAGLLSAAVVIPLTLLRYTLRAQGGEFNTQILVPAIAPVVIAVLIFEYVEYNKRIDDAFSAQLISPDLVQLADVKWAGGAGSHLSGRVINRSPHHLIGMSLEILLYAGSEKLGGASTDSDLDVGPGQQGKFDMSMLSASAAPAGTISCADERAGPLRRGGPRQLACVYRLKSTRGEEVM